MNYILKPTLEHMALVKIVAALWNQSDIRALIATFSYSVKPERKEWKLIEEKVMEKVLHLPLPDLLKEKIWGFIKPMGLEIFNWIKFHCRDTFYCTDSFFHANLPNEVCWTPQGTIDRKRMAQMLVKDASLDLPVRFMLACVYCLEYDVRKLWNELDGFYKDSFLFTCFIYQRDLSGIVCFWIDELEKRGNLLQMQEIFDNKVETHAEEGNKTAVEYFLQKLPPGEREITLVSAAKHARDAHVLCYLLSQMNDEQQADIFEHKPCEMLQCFLNFPLQSLFMETADHMWDLLNKQHIVTLLEKIVKKINSNHNDWDYQKLFSKLWQKMSNSDKSYILGKIIEMESNSWYILLYLFEINDESKVKQIFQHATVVERRKFIFCYKGKIICQTLIQVDEWSSLELMFKECLSSKDEVMEFKEIFKEYIKQYISNDQIEILKEKFDKFFHLLDHLICDRITDNV